MNTEQQQNNAESQNNTMLSTQEGLNITFTNENPMQEEQIQEETDAMEEVQPVKGKSKRKEKKSKPYNPSSATNVRKHRKNITFHDIAACFDMPIRDASQLLGISLTQLKRLCREFQIPRLVASILLKSFLIGKIYFFNCSTLMLYIIQFIDGRTED